MAAVKHFGEVARAEKMLRALGRRPRERDGLEKIAYVPVGHLCDTERSIDSGQGKWVSVRAFLSRFVFLSTYSSGV